MHFVESIESSPNGKPHIPQGCQRVARTIPVLPHHPFATRQGEHHIVARLIDVADAYRISFTDVVHQPYVNFSKLIN